MPTRGIPFPAGDPALAPEREREWRALLVARALEAVGTPVSEPTVFEASAQLAGG